MDKLLYISLEYFKKNPEHGLLVRLNDGSEYFYQTMVNVYKPTIPKWKDSQMVGLIKQSDIVEYIKLPDYIKEKKINLGINDINLFIMLTKNYPLTQKLKDRLNGECKEDKELIKKSSGYNY